MPGKQTWAGLFSAGVVAACGELALACTSGPQIKLTKLCRHIAIELAYVQLLRQPDVRTSGRAPNPEKMEQKPLAISSLVCKCADGKHV